MSRLKVFFHFLIITCEVISLCAMTAALIMPNDPGSTVCFILLWITFALMLYLSVCEYRWDKKNRA